MRSSFFACSKPFEMICVHNFARSGSTLPPRSGWMRMDKRRNDLSNMLNRGCDPRQKSSARVVQSSISSMCAKAVCEVERRRAGGIILSIFGHDSGESNGAVGEWSGIFGVVIKEMRRYGGWVQPHQGETPYIEVTFDFEQLHFTALWEQWVTAENVTILI